MYVGGSGLNPVDSDGHCSAEGGYNGGGSSFISGYDRCDAIDESSTADNIIHTGQFVHYTGYRFTNGVMIAGNESMPDQLVLWLVIQEMDMLK